MKAIITNNDIEVSVECARAVIIPGSNTIVFYDTDGRVIRRPIVFSDLYHICIQEAPREVPKRRRRSSGDVAGG